MSITVTMTNRKLAELHEALDFTSKTVPNERDDLDAYRRSNYRISRNYSTALSLLQGMERKMNKMEADYKDDSLDLYNELRVAICKAHCVRSANGDPEYDTTQDCTRSYSINPDIKEDFDKAIKAHRELYKETLERKEAHDKAVKDVLDEEVTVELKTIKWADVPLGMTGVWRTRLMIMITDLPENLEED